MIENKIKYSPEVVMSLISSIPDPEIPVLNIRELGMLQSVETDDEGYVIKITPTYTACPAMKTIEDQIKEICSAHGIKNVKVKLVYSPAWTTDWISIEAKDRLKKYGIAPPQKNACSRSVFKGESLSCPRCSSRNTELISQFGSTACKALYRCNECKEPFEYFKCH